jgi:hypothetical protein
MDDSSADPDGDGYTNFDEYNNTTDPCTFDGGTGNNPPVITSTAPPTATVGVLYSYSITCTDADLDPLLLYMDLSDTCGGAVMDYMDGTGDYFFTPTGPQGGTTCYVGVACDDMQDWDVQTSPVDVSAGGTGDSDGDGMPDGWEDTYGCVDSMVGDSLEDPDGDGFTNLDEYNNSTDPCMPESFGCDLFVSTLGGATAPCSQIAPCSSINYAVGLAGDGDIVCVGAGNYPNQSNIQIQNNITLLGGFNPITWARNVPVQRTHVGGGGGGTIFYPFDGSLNVTIDGFVLQNANIGVDIQDASFTLSNNIMFDFTSTAINVFTPVVDPASLTMSNNLLFNNLRGILAYAAYDNLSIDSINNTIVNNSDEGIYRWYNNGSVITDIRNSIIYGNPDDINITDGTTVQYSDIGEGYPGTGNISRNPAFWGTSFVQHGLQPGSSCIDAGDPAPVYNDFDGSRNDMGFTGGPNSAFSDRDLDGMPDTWEVNYALNRSDPADALDDLDSDGLNNRLEYFNLTGPDDPDTDDDGMPDGFEVIGGGSCGLDPFNPGDAAEDHDGDFLNNLAEYGNSTDPCRADTDGGGEDDKSEVDRGSNPLDPGDDLLCDLFVSVAGGSTAPCTLAQPCNSINYAVATAGNGDMICVSEGIYYENVNLNISGSVTIFGGFNPATWERNVPVFRTVVDGGGIDSVFDRTCCGQSFTIDGLIIQNGLQGINLGDGTFTFSNNIIRDNAFAGIAGPSFQYYDFTINTSNNLITGNNQGLWVGNWYSNSSLNSINDTIEGNAGDGVYTYYAGFVYSTNAFIRNGIVFNNGPDLYLDGAETSQVSYTDVGDGATGTGGISADPLFWDTGFIDHGLQSGSL